MQRWPSKSVLESRQESPNSLSGEFFPVADTLVEGALDRLQVEKPAILRALIAEATADIEAGRVGEYNEEFRQNSWHESANA